MFFLGVPQGFPRLLLPFAEGWQEEWTKPLFARKLSLRFKKCWIQFLNQFTEVVIRLNVLMQAEPIKNQPTINQMEQVPQSIPPCHNTEEEDAD